MLSLFKLLIVVFIMLSVSSCEVAPGMKMEPLPPPSVIRQAHQFKIEPTFVPITANLLSTNDALRRNSDYEYYVGPQDIINIVVWNHPEFNYPVESAPSLQGRTGLETMPTVSPAGFLVDAKGNIFFPLVGNLSVENKTVNEIRSNLMSRLRKYVRNPQVSVRVSGFRNEKVYVMGEVTKGGTQPITDVPLSITDAINLAGGFNVDTADPSHIYVIRGNITRPTVYWLNAQSPDAMILADHFILKDRDIVFVSTAGVARWNRAISLILPSLQTVWYTGTFINATKNSL